MIKLIDELLNRFTMYRLTLYYLAALLGLGFVLSFFAVVQGGPVAVVATTAILLAVSLGANAVFARIWKLKGNPDDCLPYHPLAGE